jgi:predicted aspartyl protease
MVLVAVATPSAGEPITFYNGRLFVQARINGIPTEALLDSAAEATLVDPAFAAKAKLGNGSTQEIRGSGGTAKAQVVEGATIDALGQQLHPDAIVVTDLAELSRRLVKRQTRVVLGRELFDAARLKIDISRGTIVALARDTTPPGQRLALTHHAGVESVSVVADGMPLQAEFDLGNGSGVLISRAAATRLGLNIIGHKIGGGIGGSLQRDLVRLTSLQVAGRSFHNIVAAIDDQSNAQELNIGTSILKHFEITTDFQQRAVWLAPERR